MFIIPGVEMFNLIIKDVLIQKKQFIFGTSLLGFCFSSISGDG